MTGAGQGTNPLDVAARRVDTAVERAGLLDPAAQKVALALKSAVEEFHREGLATIVRRLKDDPDGRRLLFELVDDPGVYALLLMHGLVRADPVTLAERALAEVRPYLESHGEGVELAGVELPVVRVRLSGACTGCSQSSATLRQVVEQAMVTAVPGAERVEVVPAAAQPSLVPLGSVRLRPGAAPPAGAFTAGG
jgi:Fe-S cluster biogenesis protein NfuA